MDKSKIMDIVNKMTLEEKAYFSTGYGAWYTKDIERLGIPKAHVSDGPHGLRAYDPEGDPQVSIKAVNFPAEVNMAASFNRDLLYEVGKELGKQSQAEDVDVVLGPGINIKRGPLCGRNFEYYSEDPLLAGEMAAAYIKGIQSEGVGTSLKHFFANNQEHRRFDGNSELDSRTMREIYLTAFEIAVKKAHPWTVMASYNKINGTHSTQAKYLKKILRDEWGFKGMVTSDWLATHDRVAVIEAGCDLTMPSDDERNNEIVKAVRDGTLDEKKLDECCARILELVFKTIENDKKVERDLERGHSVSAKAAEETLVLLTNNGILPLKKDCSAAFIGLFADKPRFQGGGSSNINAFKTVGALEAAKKAGYKVIFAEGYDKNGNTSDELIESAKKAAKSSDVAVIFAGLHDEMESEGADRTHMRLSEGHLRLIHEICMENPNTVVVLHNGSPVEMPWVNEPAAILEAYLGGQGVGEAEVKVLYGDVNPSGHLAETFPLKLSDNPSYLFYGGEGDRVQYREGVFVGYRYYTTKEMNVLFPFGHGLSYTCFEYSNLSLSARTLKPGEKLAVSVNVRNTGSVSGKALVQLYVAPHHVDIIRPVRELKGFEKIELAPGEEKTVTIELDERAFAHWNESYGTWKCERGIYEIQICENAHSPILSSGLFLDFPALRPFGGFTKDISLNTFAGVEAAESFILSNFDTMISRLQSKGQLSDDFVKKYTGKAREIIHGYCEDPEVEKLLAESLEKLVRYIPEEKYPEFDNLMDGIRG